VYCTSCMSTPASILLALLCTTSFISEQSAGFTVRLQHKQELSLCLFFSASLHEYSQLVEPCSNESKAVLARW